jgi:hypothetical protein
MVELWEYLLLGGTAYWIMTKAKDYRDEGAKRALVGVGAGLLVAYKGPEIYRKLTGLNSSPDGKAIKNRLTAATVAAIAGYMFGDKLIGGARNAYRGLKSPEAAPAEEAR